MARKTVERRAVQVCQLCHQHKIRCEIPIKGTACMRCKETGETCVLRSRKAYSTRKKKATSRSATSNSSVVPVDSALSCDEARDLNGSTPEKDNCQSDLIVATVVSRANGDTNTAPLFVGDQHGIAALLETDRPTALGKKHFMIPTVTAELLEPDDLHYLKIKGCFSLPDADVCESLVQCYFEFVHSSFPVLDAKAFLDAYAESGVQAINLLLLWSMFSVATSVCLYPPLSILRS
jgi:Fungal Zn(2)-Cys(6) binuclear cluster domain